MNPLVKTAQIVALQQDQMANGGIDPEYSIRDLYEADRAASRLLIEKLKTELANAAQLANDAVIATMHPGSQFDIDKVNTVLDRFRATLKEANAFLNP